jgi:hypothetical protein
VNLGSKGEKVMAKAQYADRVHFGRIPILCRLVPAAKSKVDPLTKTVHKAGDDLHAVKEERRYRCEVEGIVVPGGELASAVILEDGRRVVLSEKDEEKAAGRKAYFLTDYVPLQNLEIWKAENAFYVEQDPTSKENVKNANDVHTFLASRGIALGGDLVVSGVTRKGYVVPISGRRLILFRFHYKEDLNEEPEGTRLGPGDDDLEKIAQRIGKLKELQVQEELAVNPKRLALRDRAKMTLLRRTEKVAR